MKSTLLSLLLTLATVSTRAQGPNGSNTYYANADGKKGAALKTSLAAIIVNPTNVGYDGLYEAYKKTDTRADGYVRDWYSNATNYRHGVDNKGNYNKEGDMYNREHSVPQSWFSGSGIKSDIVHVLPTDGYVNNRRSNYPFGEVNVATYQSANGYSKLGSCKTEGYSGTVFEPNDEIKGDIARIYFYMITRYESSCGSWGNDVFTSSYPGLTQWALNMMMRWSKADPVDEREIQRNNAVFEVQGNRNPYVDYPGLEEYTWGSKTNVAFSYDNYEGSQADFVSQPVFSPEGGTYKESVTVTMSCTTEGATIYYTTDGTDATVQAIRYDAPVTLTESATLKAVAVKDGKTSTQMEATYTITTNGGSEQGDHQYDLTDSFFGTSYGGSIDSKNKDDLTAEKDGITVTYALGTGSNRYCSSEQIRLYPGNTLTVSTSSGTLTGITFISPDPKDGLQADSGTMNGQAWTGDARQVVFTFTGSKHIKLSNMAVTLAETEPTAVSEVKRTTEAQQGNWYAIDGRSIKGTPKGKGVYVRNGKKVVVK